MKKLFIPILIIVLTIPVLIFINQSKPQIQTYPNDWFFMQRAFPDSEINHEAYIEGLKKTRQQLKEKALSDEESIWEFAGPLNITGRITDVEMHPDNLEEIYIGAASGGVFKSNDLGASWNPIFDSALSLSIGDMAIAPSDKEIIYVGTGEANCGGGSLAYEGVGVYRSEDGGQSWEWRGLENSRNIGRMVVHPNNPEIVYAAVMGSLFADGPDRGIYKTEDGGQNWQQVLYLNDSTGGIDIVIHPNNPDTLYAAMWERVRRPDRRSYGGPGCGIYRSTNGGNSWMELTNGLPSPSANAGRIGIDISRSEPEKLYAIYADKVGYFEGVYKTSDNGDSWTQTNDGSLGDSYQSYGWWFGRICVNPVDPDIAFVIGFDLYRTTNGGNSWSNVSSSNVHVDQHGMYIHPESGLVALGNDGGLYLSNNGGNSWDWKNNLPITQFYTCEVDNQYPNRLYGGTQDNGTNRTMTGEFDDWQPIYWGDGFYVLVDPENNNYVYAEYQYGNFARSTNGGSSFNTAMNGISSSDRKNWNTPVVFDPSNPEILYYGANRIYQSTNRASSWSAISDDLTNGSGNGNLTYGTITTISVSPINPEIIYVGTDDGNVWVSSPTGMGWTLISFDLPIRWVTRVAADPLEENTAYVTFSGYRNDEYLPHIFRTTDKGESWTDISSNLPEMPLNDVIIDTEDNSILYVATDATVYVSRNLGQSWDILGTGLPMVPVNDLTLHNTSRKLIAGTFGRSMYSYDLNQDTITTQINPDQKISLSADLNVFPNPFSSQLTIQVHSSADEYAIVEIVGLDGQKVAEIFKGSLQKGINKFSWRPGNDLSSNIFVCTVMMNRKQLTQKLIYKK
jgi:photosystem II stability/assembly factor-like uncharacterized protein